MQRRFIDDYSVILLDMGHTFVFDCDRFGPDEDYHSTYRKLGGTRLDPAGLSHVINTWLEVMMASYRDPACYDDFGTVETFLRQLPQTAGLPEAELAILAGVVARHEAGTVAEPHVGHLRALSKSHPLGLVSNVWAHHGVFEEVLDEAGVLDLFEVIVWSSDHGCVKPSPRLFEKALAHFDVPPEAAVYVGDDPKRDVAGAKGVGMASVWIENALRPLPIGGPQPDLIIPHLGALLTA